MAFARGQQPRDRGAAQLLGRIGRLDVRCRCRRPAAAGHRRRRGNARPTDPASPSKRWRFSAASTAALAVAEAVERRPIVAGGRAATSAKSPAGRVSAKRICMEFPRKCVGCEVARSFRPCAAPRQRGAWSARRIAAWRPRCNRRRRQPVWDRAGICGQCDRLACAGRRCRCSWRCRRRVRPRTRRRAAGDQPTPSRRSSSAPTRSATTARPRSSPPSGQVRMSRDGNYLAADRVSWNRKTGEVVAEGNVVVVNPRRRQADRRPRRPRPTPCATARSRICWSCSKAAAASPPTRGLAQRRPDRARSTRSIRPAR